MILSRRKYEIKTEDRELLDYIPPASVFLGGLIFIIGTAMAIFFYESPNGGYDIFNQFFSELGIRNDYTVESNGESITRYAPPNPEIFNITLFCSGFLIMPFFLFSYRQMRNSNRLSNFILIFATTGGFLSGIFMIGVGIFDLSFSGSGFLQSHSFWVAGLYLGIAYTSVLWFIMLITASNLPYKTSKFVWMDYILLVALVGVVVINIADNLNIIPVEALPFLSDFGFPIETYQKLIAYLFFSYYGLIVGGRLTKTKYDNTPVEVSLKRKANKYYCTNCGSQNPANAPFCTDCGIRLMS